jgi:hypothetical protein
VAKPSSRGGDLRTEDACRKARWAPNPGMNYFAGRGADREPRCARLQASPKYENQEAEAQAEREIERLHAKIGQLTVENDFVV